MSDSNSTPTETRIEEVIRELCTCEHGEGYGHAHNCPAVYFGAVS